MRRLVYIALLVAVAGGCSIKEDRDDCPCRLIMDFSEIDTVLVKSLNVLATCNGKTVFSDHVFAYEFEEE